jgi:hypothetical protein
MMEESGTTPRTRIDLVFLIGMVFLMTAAGAAAGFVFDATFGKYDAKLPDVASASEKQINEGIELQKAGNRKSSAFGCGSAGAILGAVFGLAMGLLRRNAGRAGLGLAVGVLLGGSLGAVGGYITQELSEYTIGHGVSSTISYLMISTAFWLAIGIATGLTAVIVGSRSMGSGERFAGPLVGAILAAVLTPVLAGVAFPLDYKGRIPPRERTECYFVGAVGAALLALGAGYSGSRRVDPP